MKSKLNTYYKNNSKEIFMDKARFGSAFYEIRNYEELVNKINENKKEPSRFEVTIKVGFETLEEVERFKRLLKLEKPKEYQLDEQDWSGK